MNALQDSLLELIRRTSAEIPDDVQKAILDSLEREKKGTIAESALKIIERNIALARQKSQPICQDTGSILFYVDCPTSLDQIAFEDTACLAVKKATKLGCLRQNSVDSLTGINDGTNVGPGSPTFHFHQHHSDETSVRLVLKGGGPGILGVCIGGDRATGYEFSKRQFLRLLDDRNPVPELDMLEQDILNTANELGIGPMGL